MNVNVVLVGTLLFHELEQDVKKSPKLDELSTQYLLVGCSNLLVGIYLITYDIMTYWIICLQTHHIPTCQYFAITWREALEDN